MRVLKILLLCLVFNPWFNQAQAQSIKEEPQNESKLDLTQTLINDVLPIILTKLSPKDLLQLSSVSRGWLNTVENTFYFLAEIKADDLVGNLSYRELYFLSSIMINMKNWDQEQLVKIIENTNFLTLEEILIKSLEKKLLKEISNLAMETNKDLASFLFVHSVNLDDAQAAAWNMAKLAHLVFGKKEVFNAAGNFAMNSALTAAADEAEYAAFSTTQKTADEATYAREMYEKDSKNAINNALEKYKHKTGEEIGVCSYKLSNLYVIAYMVQDIFVEECFINFYKVFKQQLDNDINFNLSIGDIVNSYAEKTWLKDEYKNNPYVISLKLMAENLVAKVTIKSIE